MIFPGVATSGDMQDFRSRLAHAMGFKSPDDVTGADCAKLAGEVGLTRQAIERVVTGRSKYLSAPNMSIVARHLGIDTDWLATGDTRPGLSHQALAFGAEFDKFPVRERDSLLEQCRGVLRMNRAMRATLEAQEQPDKSPKTPRVHSLAKPRAKSR